MYLHRTAKIKVIDGTKFDRAAANAGDVYPSPKKNKVLAIPDLYT